MHPETDNPDRFASGAALTTGSDSTLTVDQSQTRGGTLLVRFVDVLDRTAAEAIVGEWLYVDAAERRALADDEFWPDELVGLVVLSTTGAEIGVVADVIEGSAQHRLVIHGPAGDFEVPFVAELVPSVDIAAGTLEVSDLPGLIPGS